MITHAQIDEIVGKYLMIRGTWFDEKYSTGQVVTFPNTTDPAFRYSAFVRTQEECKNACYSIQQEIEALGYEARTMPHSAKRGDGRRVPKIEIYIRKKQTC